MVTNDCLILGEASERPPGARTVAVTFRDYEASQSTLLVGSRNYGAEVTTHFC